MKYLKYLKYLFRHIHYVRKACWAKGLYWQGLVHDLSKFRPSEIIPYVGFLEGYLVGLTGYLHVHGMGPNPDEIKAGEDLRNKIKELS